MVAGLLGRYEETQATVSSEPGFVKYWGQWAIGAVGHFYKYKLKGEDQWKFKNTFISADGPKYWGEFRRYLISFFQEFFDKCFPGFLEYQKVFKNNEKAWESAKLRDVRPRDIWQYIRREIKSDSYKKMRERQREVSINLEYYDVNFAILARLLDKYFDKKTPPKL